MSIRFTDHEKDLILLNRKKQTLDSLKKRYPKLTLQDALEAMIQFRKGR